MAAEVFVSYRWGNASRDAVGRLASELKRRLGAQCVRIDIENKADGESLRSRIQREIKEARVVVVAIHPDWIESVHRLCKEEDLVRLEIEAAFEFGIPVLPVLLSGARSPTPEELPPSMRALCDLPMTPFGEHATYDADIQDFARTIARIIGGRATRYVSWFASVNTGNIAFGIAILGALMLFISRMLDIHAFRVKLPLDVWVGGMPAYGKEVLREVGVLMAWNWVVVLILVTPLMILLANTTLRQAKELLDSLQIRKMIQYVGDHGSVTPANSRRIWEAIARPTAVWCQVFIAIALVLGCTQWWQYSGQWYFRGYDPKLFILTSTGPDWHVGWALGVEHLVGSAGAITVFTLAMYLVYGVGSALTFSYYAFLFNFFSELSQLSSSAGSRSSVVLRLDPADKDSGGLGAFARMQRSHAAFCYWSVLAMYFMALRNAYLPLTCRLPLMGAPSESVEACSSMGSFALMILSSVEHFIETLLSGRPAFKIILHTYSESNHFVIGSMLHAVLIAAFFYLISSRMLSIVESARHGNDPRLAEQLIRSIQAENTRVLVILLLGAVSTVFLNLGPFVVVAAVVLLMAQRLLVRR